MVCSSVECVHNRYIIKTPVKYLLFAAVKVNTEVSLPLKLEPCEWRGSLHCPVH